MESLNLSIATNEQVLNWSKGEVKKPETINYKTFKPEKEGLFCERIFGPVKDYRCPVCGKKHKRVDEGRKCLNCGESIIYSSSVRRRFMGHIQLATPVAHIWFTKVNYSMYRLLLDLKQKELEAVIYLKSHIVVQEDPEYKKVKEKQIISINDAPKFYMGVLEDILKKSKAKNVDQEQINYISATLNELVETNNSNIGTSFGIDFYVYNEIIAAYTDIRIDTSARAIQTLLKNYDLKKNRSSIKRQIKKNKNKSKLFRRLKVVESFISSGQDPASMILENIPVIPSDLRPLIQLDGGRHSTVDINELYRRIIIRNNRLKSWIEIDAPPLIIQNEKRMLQESVDALIDNQRKAIPVLSKDGRQLKSLTENIKGKQGRFRQNLLGKRVDYSGRSVIVVGPDLKLNQCALPRDMVIKLYEPFIINLLMDENVAHNVKAAKKLLEDKDEIIWKYAERVVKGRPVLLNRAPTLHRLSIQAFEVIITNGKAIKLHPLVTPAFNADFDGDQMAVHVPLSDKAAAEARELVISRANILSPKDGKLILSPSQDMVLGVYYLTNFGIKKETNEGMVFSSFQEAKNAYLTNGISTHAKIVVSSSAFGNRISKEIRDNYRYIVTTVGRVIFNESFPEDFPYINEVLGRKVEDLDKRFLIKDASEIREKLDSIKSISPINKSQLAKVIEIVHHNYDNLTTSDVLDNVKDLGFKYSSKSGISIAIGDLIDVNAKDKILAQGDKKVDELWKMKKLGYITDDERYLATTNVWSKVKDEVKDELDSQLVSQKRNSLFQMMDSGARGNISNFLQLAGIRGLMSKPVQQYAALQRQGIIARPIEEIPIKSSFKTGLTSFEFFLSTHGARKGLSDTATKTAESGYLTRRLVDAAQNITIKEEDCKSIEGTTVRAIVDNRTGSVIESLEDRIINRYSAKDIDGIVSKDELITEEIAMNIVKAKIEEVEIRSVLSCKTRNGLCKKCFGIDLATGTKVSLGEAVGIVAAQSIGEPGTQLTMRSFHTGGVAGVSDITQGFARLMELLDANKNPKSAAVIAKVNGKVASIKQESNSYLITVSNEIQSIEYKAPIYSRLRIKKGDVLKPGDKITEGSIQLYELLKYAGIDALQSYLLKEVQKLYRLQGIVISDKHIEIIVRQMLSKVIVMDPGDSKLFLGQKTDLYKVEAVNEKLLKKGKLPVYFVPELTGVKPLPTQYDSFLASASYQRTAESLVEAALTKKYETLTGIKENIILGKRIPAGTGASKLDGKYAFINDLHELKEAKSVDFQISTDSFDEQNSVTEESIEELISNL
ncbi:MAG: DNA-directed RNA polymerase subunit beta' [Mycoplasmataceae bacterium]|nr:DNA-directed RNA polymerase subunit beta' [Mycoplasmataceae bacterium]